MSIQIIVKLFHVTEKNIIALLLNISLGFINAIYIFGFDHMSSINSYKLKFFGFFIVRFLGNFYSKIIEEIEKS
jgi:hypothetical protein